MKTVLIILAAVAFLFVAGISLVFSPLLFDEDARAEFSCGMSHPEASHDDIEEICDAELNQ